MVDGVLLSRSVFGISTSTAKVFAAGAVWLVPAATLTVTVAEPAASASAVMMFPATVSFTMPAGLAVAVTAPSPGRVAVTVPVSAEGLRERLAGLRERLPAALPMLHATVFAAVLPSVNW